MLGDSWGNALLEGQQFAQNYINNNYANAAHAANVAQYGPQAGDPAAMSQLENTNFLSKFHPLQLANQADQNRIQNVNANIAQGTQAGDIAAKLTNDSVIQRTGQYQVDNAASAASANASAAAAAKVAADNDQSAQHVNAVFASSETAQKYLDANPGDLAGAYDAGVQQASTIAPDEGAKLKRGTPAGDAAFAQFQKDPQGFISAMKQQGQSTMDAIYKSMPPDKLAAWMKSNADVRQAQTMITGELQKQAATANDDVTKLLGEQGPLGAGLKQTDSALGNIAEMRKLVDGMSKSTFWNDAVQKHVSGSGVQQLQALGEAVGGALSTDMMSGLRQVGGNMGGIRSTTEFNKIGDAVAKIDPAMTVGQLKTQLDNAEKAINQYKAGAQQLLDTQYGTDAYKQARARKLQADRALNQAQGIYETPDGAPATAPPSASPAASAPPSGAAGVPVNGVPAPAPAGMVWDSQKSAMVPAPGASAPAAGEPVPRVGGPVVQPQPSGPPIGTFAAAVSHTLGAEGGYNSRDANGAPVNLGINGAAHPGEDIRNMTPERATQIYKSDYWDKINGDDLAKTNPGMAHAGFDIAVIDGAGKANELIKQAGGDPMKLIDLQQHFQNDLIARDPSRYGKYADAWQKRNNALRQDVASGSVGNSYASAGASPGASSAPASPAAFQSLNIPAQNAPITGNGNITPAAPQAPAAAQRQVLPQQSAPLAQGDGGRAALMAAYGPQSGAANAFEGKRERTMAGMDLVAKYLGRVA